MSEQLYNVYIHPESDCVWMEPKEVEVKGDGLVMLESWDLTKAQAEKRIEEIKKEWEQEAKKHSGTH